MGKFLLVGRLAGRDLRRRPAQAVLLLLAIAVASATLTLGVVLHGVTSHPYEQTRAATNGPDVVAQLGGPAAGPHGPGQQNTEPQVAGQVKALVHDPGVTGHSGPYPVASALLRVRGLTAGVEVEGRNQAPASLEQPIVTAGSWVRRGGVVLERTFAEALGVGVGDRVTLNGRAFRVTGTAVTAAAPPYPNLCYSPGGGTCGVFDLSTTQFSPGDIGLAWVTQPDARALASSAAPLWYFLNLRLKDPATAQAFVNRHGNASFSPGAPTLISWQSIAAADGLLVQDEQQVLSVGAWLAGLLITSPGAGLVGAPGAPSLTAADAGLVLAAALAVGLAATLVPAIRAARTSTVSALADAARPPRRRALLIAVSARLPVPLLLGLRLVARRPRRAALGAASIAVTVTGIVAVLAFHATAGEKSFGGSSGLGDPVASRDEQILLVITIVLVALAVLNAIFTAWATVLGQPAGIGAGARASASPQQVSAGLAAAQVLPALPGAILGVPLGIGLFAVANGAAITTIPPVSWLLATVLGTLVAVAGLTTIPARIAARRPVAEILQSETA